MICCAALCPGMPLTVPPGQVPEPHRYKPSIGVALAEDPANGRSPNMYGGSISRCIMLALRNPNSRSRSAGVKTGSR